ncbi:unnamed protein product [Durusdinium trenchii]|uniref:Uncharacterized protein n=2 Tax=Durusdinium trenchii TaxID=1381693 RepID=A0ABP0QJD4_9DINO
MCQLHSQGLPVPEVLYRDGCSTYTLPSPVPALVRILTYLEGDLIKNEAPKSPALLRRIGALCGSVAVALESFDAKGVGAGDGLSDGSLTG